MNKTVKGIILMLTVIAMLVTSGCNTEGNGDFSISIPKDFPANVGGTVVESCPYNVVSISPAITGVIYSLGSNSQLVGVSDLCDYPEIKSDMARVGTISRVDLNKIISLDCDLLLTETALSNDVTSELEAANINIAVIKAPDEYDKAAQFYRDVAVAISGMHTGKLNAENTFNRMDKQLRSVKENYDTSQKPRAVVILAYNEAVATGDKAVGKMLEFTGAQNIARDAKNYIFNTEQIAKQDPQYIFCRQSDLDKIKSDIKLQSTIAVKNNRVFAVDIGQLQRMSDYAVDSIKQMCDYMYNAVEKQLS